MEGTVLIWLTLGEVCTSWELSGYCFVLRHCQKHCVMYLLWNITTVGLISEPGTTVCRRNWDGANQRWVEMW